MVIVDFLDLVLPLQRIDIFFLKVPFFQLIVLSLELVVGIFDKLESASVFLLNIFELRFEVSNFLLLYFNSVCELCCLLLK
jgi:hypothetical protein